MALEPGLPAETGPVAFQLETYGRVPFAAAPAGADRFREGFQASSDDHAETLGPAGVQHWLAQRAQPVARSGPKNDRRESATERGRVTSCERGLPLPPFDTFEVRGEDLAAEDLMRRKAATRLADLVKTG